MNHAKRNRLVAACYTRAVGELADSVEKAIAAPLLPAGQALLVACSGGADSVALAHAAALRRDLRVALGHVDHGLRPESRAEAGQVETLGKQLGVAVFVERLEPFSTREAGLEAAAREARYAALSRLAEQARCSLVATAHTRRDQAETLLLRLIRGAGPGAMAGIRRSRELAPGVTLVRPLLAVSRDATEAYCREHGLAFVTDPHNSDPRRARAALRALWPRLLELNPRLEEAIAAAAEIFADEDELLQSLASAGASLHPALERRALHASAVAAGLRPERKHLEQLRQLLSAGRGSLDMPGGRATITWDPGVSGTRYLSTENTPPELAVPGPGSYRWRSRELLVELGTASGIPVDLERAPFPWTLRTHRSGDRFRPGGGRTKKVAELWIDAHIPRGERKDLALLADARGQLFWVEGVREGEPSRRVGSAAASFRFR